MAREITETPQDGVAFLVEHPIGSGKPRLWGGVVFDSPEDFKSWAQERPLGELALVLPLPWAFARVTGVYKNAEGLLDLSGAEQIDWDV